MLERGAVRETNLEEMTPDWTSYVSRYVQLWGINNRVTPNPYAQGTCSRVAEIRLMPMTQWNNKITKAPNRYSTWLCSRIGKLRQQKLGLLREGYRNETEATFVHKVNLKDLWPPSLSLPAPPNPSIVTSGSTDFFHFLLKENTYSTSLELELRARH